MTNIEKREGMLLDFDELKNCFNSNAWVSELYVELLGGVWDVWSSNFKDGTISGLHQ